MFRKNEAGLHLFFVCIAFLLSSGCSTNSKAISDGRFFNPHFDHYDLSLPIEEQCVFFVIDSPRQFFVQTINGKRAYRNGRLTHRSLTILPPGEYSFSINELVSIGASPTMQPIGQTNSYSSLHRPYTEDVYETYTIKMNFHAGHYYFLSTEYGPMIDDLEKYSEIKISSNLVSTETVIEGIKASIAKRRSNFH